MAELNVWRSSGGKKLIRLELLGNLGVNFQGFGINSCHYFEWQHILLQIITLIMPKVHLQDNLEMIL